MQPPKIALAALLLLGTSTSAFAAIDPNALNLHPEFAFPDTSSLNITVKDGVALISGEANPMDIALAKRMAQKLKGVNRIEVAATTPFLSLGLQ